MDDHRHAWYRHAALVGAGLAISVLGPVAMSVGPAWGRTQTAPPGTVGIALIDGTASGNDNPRARDYIVDHVAPGFVVTRRIAVSNGTDRPQAVQLYAGAATISDSRMQFGDGHAANDLTGWTTITPTVVEPAAGSSSEATVTIAVPADASPGERYAVAWAELPSSSSGGLTAVNRVGVRIYLSVGAGAEPATDFTIASMEAVRAADGRPAVVATVENLGGRAIDLGGELTLTDGPGRVSAGPFEIDRGTTIGIDATGTVAVALDMSIPSGPWTAKMVVTSGDTTRQATAEVTFPSAPATSSGPVAAKAGGAGRAWGPPLLMAAVAVAACATAGWFLLGWHRRRDQTGDQPVSPRTGGR